MEQPGRSLRGPFATFGWVVAAGWLGVGGLAWWRLPEPWGWVVAGCCLLAAVATALVARGLRVDLGPAGVAGPGLAEVPWSNIDHVGVRSGLAHVPFIVVQRGRALDEVALDGIAAFSRRAAVALAEQVADAGDLGDVVIPDKPQASGPGRRGIPG